MPSFVRTPACLLHAAYTPIVWRVMELTVPNRLPPAIMVDFSINGSVFQTVFLSPIESVEGADQYFFEVNAQEVLEMFFNNADALPVPGTALFATGFSAEIEVIVTPWLDDGSGLLSEDAGAAITSQSIYVINAYRRSTESVCLNQYATGVDNRPWLTRIDNQIDLCIDSNFYLSVYNGPNVVLYGIESYNSNGDLLESGAILPIGANFQEIQILGVGPLNINQGGLWANGSVTITPEVSYYEIIGYGIAFPSAVRITPTFRINVDTSCCDNEIWFLNSFGVYEVFPVSKSQILTYRTSGSNYTSSRLSTVEANYLLSRGTEFLNKEGQNIYQFSLPQSRTGVREWYKDLFASPDVYLNKGGDLIPVLLSNGSFDLLRNFNLVVTLTWSNKDYSQRS